MTPSPLRTQLILDAAETLFLKHGLRGTSMEAIAARAKVAKPTLYAYFPDKGALFAALADRLAAAWRAEMMGALYGEGDVVRRVGGTLIAKHKAVWRLLEGSPHAAELYGEHDRGGAPQLIVLESELSTAIERALIAAGASRARLVTQLLIAASHGIGRRAQSPAELGPALRLLAERLIRPELPPR